MLTRTRVQYVLRTKFSSSNILQQVDFQAFFKVRLHPCPTVTGKVLGLPSSPFASTTRSTNLSVLLLIFAMVRIRTAVHTHARAKARRYIY